MGGFEAGQHLRVRVELGRSDPQGPDLPSVKVPVPAQDSSGRRKEGAGK